jgi:hypothetical protein
MPGTLGVAVVTRHEDDLLSSLLDSLAGSDLPGALRVVVADCTSTGGVRSSLAVAGSGGGRLDVEVVRVGADLGLAAGVNVASRHLDPRGDVLVTVPGYVFTPDAIGRLRAAVQAPDVGAVVPRLVDGTGGTRPSVVGFGSVARSARRAVLSHAGDLPRRLGCDGDGSRPDDRSTADDHDDGSLAGSVRDVDATLGPVLVTGAGREALGPWDESLRTSAALIAAQADLRAAGLRTRLVPGARVRDLRPSGVGATTWDDEATRSDVAAERLRLAHHVHAGRSSTVLWLSGLVGEGLRAPFRRDARSAAADLLRQRHHLALEDR